MMLDWPSTKDVVLFVLAIYAAILSTWNLRQSLRKDRRQIRVTCGSALPAYNNGEVGNVWADIVATNIGHRPVTVVRLGLDLADGGGSLFKMSGGDFPGVEDTKLPITLADGQSARRLHAYAQIGEALLRSGRKGKVRLAPVCEDSAGTVHSGEIWEADPHELLRM